MIPQVMFNYLADDLVRPLQGRYEGDIGIDIEARLDRDHIILPGHGLFVWGGFHVQFPDGYAGLVLGRSSMNRIGLQVLTGVIDNGYTGEIGAQLHNITCDPIVVAPRQRVAQLVMIPAVRPIPAPVVTFRDTDRADQGWGSSGS